jgi:PadR family transcriptional regulator, regulatory protein PadR
MTSEEKATIQLLQGTLDLMVLRTLATIGPQHAYGIASRLQQVSNDLLNLNQGTPRLLSGWSSTVGPRALGERLRTTGMPSTTPSTKQGLKALKEETQRWRQMAGLVEKILMAGS